jgi:hypothetical protein
MEPKLRPYFERKKKELVDGGSSGSGTVTAALGLRDSALGLGDGGRSGSVKGTAALRRSGTAALGLGDGDGGAQARGRGRRRSGSCSGTGTRRQPGGATVSARAGRVRVPADQRAFYIVKNPRRIFSKTACDR